MAWRNELGLLAPVPIRDQLSTFKYTEEEGRNYS